MAHDQQQAAENPLSHQHTTLQRVHAGVRLRSLPTARRWLAAHPALVTALLVGVLTALLTGWALSRPWWAYIDVGELLDSPYLRDFHKAEYSSGHQASFRWSLPDAALVLPGAGRVAPLELRLHGDYEGMPISLDSGAGPETITLHHGWQRVFVVPRPDAWSGDVRLTITAPEQVSEADPRPRGVAVDWIIARSRGEAAPGQVILLGLSAALATLLTIWSTRRLWAGVLAGGALAVGCAAALALNEGAARLMLTDYTGRLTLVLILGGILALGIERLLLLLTTRGIIATNSQTRRVLASVALLAFLLRFGALAYPLNHNSDLPFILGRTWLVRQGELLTLFLPNLSLTPVQWELDVTIPRSPFYYILTVPVTFLPGRYGDELGMMAFSSAVDALAGVLVAILALYAGGSGRAAALAAVLAAVLPFGLLVIVSWGIFPTLLAQCLALLVVVAWLNLRSRLHQHRAMLTLAAVIALAFLSYPTALVFLGTTLAVLLALLMLRRDTAALPTLKAMLLALVVVMVLYYGWHIPALLSRTLPTLAGEATGTGDANDLTVTFQRTIDALWLQLHAKYGLLVLSLAGGGALSLLLTGPGNDQAAYTRLCLLAWGVAYIPFALIDEYVVTLILKQLVHVLPLLAILGGVLLGRLARRRWGHVVAGAILVLILWQGVLLELEVVLYAFSQLK